jgi:hypothetical protein
LKSSGKKRFKPDDYELQVSTHQRVFFDPARADPQDAFVAHVTAEVMHYSKDTSKPARRVGTAIAWLVLGELASFHGSGLTEACDAHSAELEVVRAAIDEHVEDLSDADNVVFLESLTLKPDYNFVGLLTAICEHLPASLGTPVSYAATLMGSLGLDPANPLPANPARLPTGAMVLPEAELVVWQPGNDEGWLFN